MNKPYKTDSLPRCLHCNHIFGLAEISAMTARLYRDDLCIVHCLKCGAYNEARAEPQSGFEVQPALVMRRIVEKPAYTAAVFEASVEPGIHPPPESTGSTH